MANLVTLCEVIARRIDDQKWWRSEYDRLDFAFLNRTEDIKSLIAFNKVVDLRLTGYIGHLSIDYNSPSQT